MKRRSFIKKGALFVPTLLLARKSLAQVPLPLGFLGAATQATTPSGTVMGTNSIGGTLETWATDTAVSEIFTAPVSGTLTNAFYYFNGTNASTVKIGVYSDDGDAIPNSSDLKIQASAVLTGTGSAGWVSAAFSSGTVTSGNPYWIVIFNSGVAILQTATTDLVSLKYFNGAAGFSSPPANLTGYGASTGTYGHISCYVTIV